MKSKHTKNKCYQKELGELKKPKFVESPAVKKLCELTKNLLLTLLDERNGRVSSTSQTMMKAMKT